MARRKLEDAVAQEEYIEHHDIHSFATGMPTSQLPAPAATPRSQSGCRSTISEDRMQLLRKEASEYIERYDLRQVLQDMFQKVIKERPEDPFGYMRGFLGSPNSASGAAATAEEAEAGERQRREDKERLDHHQREMEVLENRVRELEAAAAAASFASTAASAAASREIAGKEERLAAKQKELEVLQKHVRDVEAAAAATSTASTKAVAAASTELAGKEERLCAKQHEVDALQNRVRELEAAAAAASAATTKAAAALQEHAGSPADLQRQYNMYEQMMREQRQLLEQKSEQELEHQRLLLEKEHQERGELQLSELQAQHAELLQRQRAELEQQLQRQASSTALLQRKVQELESKCAAADRAARLEAERLYEEQIERQQAKIEVLQRQVHEAASAAAASTADSAAGTAAPPADAAAGAWRSAAGGATRSPSAMGRKAPPTPPLSPKPGTSQSQGQGSPQYLSYQGPLGAELNTHMLSQLLASAYAPAIAPATYCEAREDEDVGEVPAGPEVLVAVTECKSALTNGTYAWVGLRNLRPLYRLLGPEPRYLYYAAEAEGTPGWRIAGKVGSEEFVERFPKSAAVGLPVDCDRGELGGRVAECRLAQELVGKISMVSSLEEKTTIRAKLTEVFGPTYMHLEGAERGLASRSSPVVSVAHALEAQQRAVQLLHSQLAAEAGRREAAEAHAQALEEALEMLQLRIQAQLPGPPTVATLQELRAAASHGAPPPLGGGAASSSALPSPRPSVATPSGHDRGLTPQPEGPAAVWGPHLGPGQGPAPRPPVAIKEYKPVPPPTFRRLPTSFRSRLDSPPRQAGGLGPGGGPAGGAAAGAAAA